MKFTKEELEGFKKDPMMNFLAGLFGTSMEEVVSEAEKQSQTKQRKESQYHDSASCETVNEENEIENKIKAFFDKMVDENKASVTIENGHPHYTIKSDDKYKEPENLEMLVEENTTNDDNGRSFSMSKEELAEFINSYTKLENTFRKLEHAYGIDLNANADSIYTQYNSIVWNLIDKIFGSDNRDDIADYCFGDSNMTSIEDLYEELV